MHSAFSPFVLLFTYKCVQRLCISACMALQQCSFVYSIICRFVYLTIPIKCLLLSVSVSGEDRHRIKTKTQNSVYKGHTDTAQPEIETRTKMKMHNVKNIKSHHIIVHVSSEQSKKAQAHTNTRRGNNVKRQSQVRPSLHAPSSPARSTPDLGSSIQCIAECA